MKKNDGEVQEAKEHTKKYQHKNEIERKERQNEWKTLAHKQEKVYTHIMKQLAWNRVWDRVKERELDETLSQNGI